MEDVIESCYYESPLGYDKVDWFVKEVINLENKMAFYFKNTKKDIILSKEGEEAYRKTVFVDFLKEKYYLIKFVIIVT